jgi:hypothetical protein
MEPPFGRLRIAAQSLLTIRNYSLANPAGQPKRRRLGVNRARLLLPQT